MVRKGERACGRQLECVDHRGEQADPPFGRLVPSMAAETAEADISEGPKRSSQKGTLSFLSSFTFPSRRSPPQPTLQPILFSAFTPVCPLILHGTESKQLTDLHVV
jgi:hypothetical protein